jgi:DNA-binding protein H-NS
MFKSADPNCEHPGDRKMITDKFNSMSIDELWSLHEEIRAVLSSKMLEEKTRLERKLSQLRAEVPSHDLRPPYPPVLPKYRNPVRPSETWAGRGKQPRWLSDQLRSGKKLDEFLIKVA